MKSTKYCAGCRDDFYNHPGQHGAKACWSLKSARVVRRWAIGWWTEPTQGGAFTETKTYSCHNEPGRKAFYKELPDFAINPIRMKKP